MSDSRDLKIVIADEAPEMVQVANTLGYLGEDEDSQKQKTNARVLHFVGPKSDSENPFSKFKAKDLEASIWVGHSGWLGTDDKGLGIAAFGSFPIGSTEQKVGNVKQAFNFGINKAIGFVSKLTNINFSSRFNDLFLKKFKDTDKKKVKHIYLVGCEAGLVIDGKSLMAQAIADSLYAQGFTNVVIHAVANPPTPGFVNMRVDVTTGGSKKGRVRALLYNTQQDAELTKLSEAKQAKEKEIAQQEKKQASLKEQKSTQKKKLKGMEALNAAKAAKEENREILAEISRLKDELRTIETQIHELDKRVLKFLSVPANDIIAEMQRPHDTFYPSARIKADPSLAAPAKDPLQEIVLYEINKLLNKRTKDRSSATQQTLEVLRKDIAYNVSNDWTSKKNNWAAKIDTAMEALSSGLVEYKKLAVLLEVAHEKHGYDPIKRIERPAILSDSFDKKKYRESFNKKWDKFAAAINQASPKLAQPSVGKQESSQQKPQKEIPPTKKGFGLGDLVPQRLKDFVAGEPKKSEKPASPSVEIRKEPEPKPEELETAIHNIKALVEIQKQEISNYPKVIAETKFFKTKIMNTKIEKMETLNQLAINLENTYNNYVKEFAKNNTTRFEKDKWMSQVNVLLQENDDAKQKHPKLLVSRFSSRTKNLLQNIHDGNSWRGILKPLGEKVTPGNLTEAQKNNPVIKKELEKSPNADLKWTPPAFGTKTRRFW